MYKDWRVWLPQLCIALGGTSKTTKSKLFEIGNE